MKSSFWWYRGLHVIARACIFLFSVSFPAFAQNIEQGQQVYSGEYVVEVNQKSLGAQDFGQVVSSFGARAVKNLGSSALLIKRGAGAQIIAESSQQIVPNNPKDSFCIDLLKSGTVSSCSPNYEMKISATPNDPRFSDLWGMSSDFGIDAPNAWDVSTGDNEAIVAIIDTGIDYTHQDLAANAWTNPGEIAGNGIDDDNNGYIDDVHGINAITGSGNPMDDNSHGSHVAGTIGGRGNNAVGVSGVNWTVKMMGLKFLSSNGSGSLAGAVQAINYMVMMKNRGINIRVSNNSWGGGGYSESLRNAISRANDAGIIFVAAAGNEANDNDASPSYPASYDFPNVLSVAAIDKNHNLASFSNYGAREVDIAAPGVDIISTTPGNNYQRFSGTSMATPHVTGALALLLAHEPTLSATDAIARVLESGVTLPSLTNIVRTSRMLNVNRMLRNLTTPVAVPTPIPQGCAYAAESIGFNPDLTADSAEIILQADEYSTATVTLPFEFPFHNQKISTLYVSPNGVVYTKKAPTSMDYENASAAPLDSIAALQTDLVAETTPYGIRVAYANDHVTIYWLAKHYSFRSGADVVIRLSLYSDGRIEDFVQFGDTSLADFIQNRATIGMSGSSLNNAITYAYNSSQIHSDLGVRFTPHCEESVQPAAVVNGIDMYAIRDGKIRNRIQAQDSLIVGLSGTGTGLVELTAAFNGRKCSTVTNVGLSDGNAALSATIPSLPGSVKNLSISSGGVRASIKVTARSSRVGNRKISARRLSEICDTFYASLH